MGRLRPLFRLALRDALTHRGRTMLMLAVIAVPIAAVLLQISTLSPAVSSREEALATVPEGAQAVVTATTVGGPIIQLPEQLPPTPRDPWAVPATPEAIAQHLNAGLTLHEWWNSPQLIATTALTIPADNQVPAQAATLVSDIDARELSRLQLHEADAHTLAMLMPSLFEGAAPATEADVVLTREAARVLDVGLGDTVQLLAPPDTGWMSTDGRVSNVVQNSARGYRVSGIVDGSSAEAWALPTWIAPMIRNDQAGVDRHFLATGAAPVRWDQIKELNRSGVGAVSRDALTHYPDASALYSVPMDVERMLTQLALMIACVLGMLALLAALVTPALAVGAERQRRTLGLVIAVGTRPREAAAIQLLQGALLGVVGAVAGCMLGVGTVAALRATELAIVDSLGPISWWAPPLLVVLSMLLGVLTAAAPARRVARLDVVQALADRPSAAPRAERGQRRLARVGAALAILGAAICLLSMLLPGLLRAVALPGLAALTVGTAVAAPGLLGLPARLFARLPFGTMPRAAARDVQRHSLRSIPAVLAVAACTTALVLLSTTAASIHRSVTAHSTAMATPGHLLIGMATPVSDEVDEAIIGAVIRDLHARGEVTGHQPVRGVDLSTRWIDAAPAPGKECPKQMGPSFAAATDPSAPMECVAWGESYQPGFTFPTWLSSQIVVMTPEAIRATDLPGAEHAAEVLAAGGVIVNDATRVDDHGTVRLVDRDPDTGAPTTPAGTVSGTFLRGFEPQLAMSGTTAQRLGLTTRYIGEIVTPVHPLHAAEVTDTLQEITAITPVVWPIATPVPDALGFTEDWRAPSLAQLGFVGLSLLAVLATVLSVLLGRRESEPDLATMSAIGASRAQVRRYGLWQALTVLMIGVPLGLLVGVPASVAGLALLRATGLFGPADSVGVLPAAVTVSVGLMLALSALAALLLGRVPEDLAVRRRE